MGIKLYLYIFSSTALFVLSLVAIPYTFSSHGIKEVSANVESQYALCIDQSL